MNYDNKQLGHENIDHPMHDEEQEITLAHIMSRLTIDEADFLENHITNLVKEAKRPFENAKRMQAEINAIEKEKREYEITSIGKTKEEKNALWSDLHSRHLSAQNKLNQLLTRP